MSKLNLAILFSILTLIIFYIDLNTELGVASGVLYVAILSMCIFAKDKYFFLVFGLAGILLTILGYYFSPLGGEVNKILLNRFYSIFIISIMSVMGYLYFANQERLELILNNMDQLVSFVDKNFRFRYANKAYERWFGIPVDKIINEPVEKVLGEQLFEGLKPHFKGALAGITQSFEIELPEGKAEQEYVRAQYFPKKNIFGKIDGFLALVTDYTPQKYNEILTAKELEKSKERFKYALEVSSDGIWDWNMKTDEVYFSPGWIDSLGYKSEDIEYHLDFWKKIVHPDDMPGLMQKLMEHSSGNTPYYTCENRLLTKDGIWRWNLDQGKIVEWDSEGKPIRMIGTDTNIDQKKKAELALKETQKQLVHMEKLSALGKLTGSIAHEFNNPIYAIRLILEQLNEDVVHTNETGKGLNIAINECKRISNLISKLKDFYLPTSGKLKSVFLNELVMDVLQLLKGVLEKNKIEIMKDYEINFKTVFVVEDQIKQVLLNIFQNAVESFEPDSAKRNIVVRIKCSKSDAKICIEDNGSGISKEILDSIFEPFITTKNTQKGSGLGLPISYRIIEDHGGKIEVESEINQGSIFTITLPVETEK